MGSVKPVSDMRVVASLSLLYIFRMLGLFMVFPVLMLLGEDYEGATPLLLGLALGGYGLTQAVFQIPLGLLSDIWGRKPIIVIGLVVFVAGSLVAATADTVWGLIFGRALQGAGAIASAVMALVGDLTSEQNRTKAMAMIGVSIGLSFSVAMVLGPALAQIGGLATIFWVTSALALLGIAVVFLLVPTPPKGVRHGSDGLAVPTLLRNALKNPDLLRLDFGIFALHFVLTATFVAIPFAFKNEGVDLSDHWSYYLPVMVMSFIAMLPFMYIAERKRQIKKVFVLAVLFLVIAELGLSLSSNIRHWVVGLFVFFTAFNLLEATLPSLVSKQAPAGSKGTAMGVYSTCQFLGAALGGVIGGASYQQWGLSGVFVICAVVCFVWGLAALGMTPPLYLTSVCIPCDKDLQEAVIKSGVKGVEEAMWVKEQSLLYLKVDASLFDRDRLSEFLKSA